MLIQVVGDGVQIAIGAGSADGFGINRFIRDQVAVGGAGTDDRRRRRRGGALGRGGLGLGLRLEPGGFDDIGDGIAVLDGLGARAVASAAATSALARR